MHYIQYEELCRLYIANIFDLSIEEVKSVKIPSPTHPDFVKNENQIDLYWESGNEVTRSLNIADAKWRGSNNVSKMMAGYLQFVKNDISNINKAILITNTDFDDGVIGIADKYGMGLYIVRPDFDLAILDTDLKDREIIQNNLLELVDNGKTVYDYKIIRRALDSETVGTVHTSVPEKTNIQTRDIKQAEMNRMVETSANRGTPPRNQKGQTRQSTPQTGQQGGSSSSSKGGFRTPKGSTSTRVGAGTSNRSR